MALQSMKEEGQFIRDTNKGWRIKPDDFENNFTPVLYPKLTYLLYEIHWGKSVWRNWCKNDGNHAEKNFLNNDCEEIKRRENTPCSITWFLSWSPCDECSQSIIEFLKKHSNVTLEIRVSRLYRDSEDQNKMGLRDLLDHGVHISIMHLGDYSYCWRTFVTHHHQWNKKKDFRQFVPKIWAWNKQLCTILEKS